MAKKPFDKNVKKSCVWCTYGIKSKYSDEIFCKKKGVLNCDDVCRKYEYDPLKRIPQKTGVGTDYSPEDFKL